MESPRNTWILAIGVGLLPWLLASRVQNSEPESNPLGPAQAWSQAFETLADRSAPAVVSLEAYDPSRSAGRPRLLRRGSGVLLSADGLVVTNGHVVEGASLLRAALADGRRVDAQLVTLDKETDLALLRLPGSEFAYLELSNSGRARVGQWVLALGNPGGLGLSVTAGIVSGVGRNNLGLARYEDFIQTDAEINPGNSGGALIDIDGRLIGINTAIGTEQEGTVGISFAVPASWVRALLEDAEAGGAPQRGYLGVESERILEFTLGRLGYDGPSRVRITAASGPAAAAGLLAGDILESIGERAIVGTADLSAAAASIRPGNQAPVRVWRAGAELEFTVTFGVKPR